MGRRKIDEGVDGQWGVGRFMGCGDRGHSQEVAGEKKN